MNVRIDDTLELKQISIKYKNELLSLIHSNAGHDLLYWCPDLIKTYKDMFTTETHIQDAISKFKEDKTPDYLIFENNKLAGLISLSPIYDNGKASEVGYWLGFQFEAKGLISRSFPFILNYAKNDLSLDYLELSTAVKNLKSQRLPLKFNFEKTKIIKDAEKLKEGNVDHILWKLNL